jgi:hypothetical protein
MRPWDLSLAPKQNNNKMKTKTKLCTQTLTESLTIIAQTWKEERCPSVDLSKLWCIQTVDYGVAPRRSEMPCQKDLEEPKCILLSERS